MMKTTDFNTAAAETPEPYRLRDAIRYRKFDTIAELIKEGADVNNVHEGEPVLMRAVCIGDVEAVKLLLEAGAEPHAAHKNGSTPLSTVIMDQREDLVALLLEHGTDANSLTGAGAPMLHGAVEYGTPEIIELLMQHGATPVLPNAEGHDAIDHAESLGKIAVAEQLREPARLKAKAEAAAEAAARAKAHQDARDASAGRRERLRINAPRLRLKP